MITVVMMAGLPGAGKSTLAVSLAKELQWDVIDKDRYRRALIESGVEKNEASKRAYTRSFKELHEALARQQSVIFDTAALQAFILREVNAILSNENSVCLKVVLCVIERHQRLLRLNKRAEEIPSHHTRDEVDPLTIADYLELFKHLPTDRKNIYTHLHSLEECVRQAKAYVIE